MSTTSETSGAIFAKITPGASVATASIMGYPVSDLLLWVTLVYTVLLLGHKVWQIWRSVREDLS